MLLEWQETSETQDESGRTRATEATEIRQGSVQWVELSAGNGVVLARDLAEWAHEITTKLGPETVIELDEYGLRVLLIAGSRGGGPQIMWPKS